MNDATIKRLNQINREFYAATAVSFDETRQRPWPGWEHLLPYLNTPLSVLDVGCGNGRFGLFLANALDAEVTYTGVDNSAALLERAQTALASTKLDYTLINLDIVEHGIIVPPLDQGDYDLVVLFGVLHHLPGADQRRVFMRQLAERVTPGGYLAFAAWRFYDFERFRQRVIPWPDDLDVEEHDYLLDWQRDVRAIRYCHFVDDTEHDALIAATGFTPITTYRADGRTNTINRYSILKRDTNADD